VAPPPEPVAPPPSREEITGPFMWMHDELCEALATHSSSSKPGDLIAFADLGAALAAQGEQTILALQAAGLCAPGEGASDHADRLELGAQACDAWVTSVRGPPLAARNPILIELPQAPDGLSTDARRQACVAAVSLYGGLGRVASKLNQYQSYRSSFPPSMRAGFDQRVGELVEMFGQLTGLVQNIAAETGTN
jgi:hypothetical protein